MGPKTPLSNLIAVLFLVAYDQSPANAQTGIDLTLRPGERGTNVVLASLQIIQVAGVFDADSRLSRRIAYVETRDGLDNDTYREGYNGGIWQLDEMLFNITQDNQTHPRLTAYYEQLLNRFGIDWPSTEWFDLRRPLFSAIASQLYLTLVDEPVPMAGNFRAQGEYWKSHYNSNPQDTVELFIDRVNSFELEECPTRGLDLVFVMDSSGSVGMQNFDLTKDFAASIVQTFSIGPEHTQVGAIAFSGFASIAFHLNTFEDREGVLGALERVPFIDISGPSTYTADALVTLRTEVLTPEAGARNDSSAIPRVAIVITDGQSNINTSQTIPAAQAVKDAGITVFAIGIGCSVNLDELDAIASRPGLVTLLTDFTVVEFQSLQRTLSVEACRIPAPVDVERSIDGTLSVGELIFLQYPLPTSGMTLQLSSQEGKVVVYVDDTIQNPNAAFYDYRLETGGNEEVYINPMVLGDGRMKRQTSTNFTNATLFVSVEGIEDTNTFTLESTFGDTSSAYMKQPSLLIMILSLLLWFTN